MKLRIASVVGARPQFVKAATVSRRLRGADFEGIEEVIVHTGQHYDDNMSDAFFRELEIPRPAHNLAVGSGSQGRQTGVMLERLEPVLDEIRPDVVLVYGDTNSTLAGALVAAKAGIRLAHVEAGLRSRRRGMPEEVNRVVTDRLADLLFCPTDAAVANLTREGRCEGVHKVGDVMYDAFVHWRTKIDAAEALARHGLGPRRFVLATVHRQENTDDPARLTAIIRALDRVARDVPVLLPLHPRTRRVAQAAGICPKRASVVEPVSYGEMVALVSNAAAIATDSGGLQKEAFFAAIPCVTLREETEWAETVDAGWNRLAPPVGDDAATTIAEAIITAADAPPNTEPPALYGDGDAAGRIASILSATA